MHGSPRDPKVTRPVLAYIIIFVSVLGIGLGFFHLNLLLGFLSALLLVVGIISYNIFVGFVRPVRKNRVPTSDFTQRRWTSVNGCTVARFERWTDKPAPLLIAIHGWQSDSSSSEKRIAPFLERDYHAVLVDLPGHGSSDGLAIWTAVESGRNVLEMMRDLANVWDWSQITSVILLGHSMGGFVSLRFADRFSEVLPKPIKRVYLESPMTSFPMVYDQRTTGFAIIGRHISRFDLQWAYLRKGPDPELNWSHFSVPKWGIPSMEVRILQAKEDIALGLQHLELLRPHANDNWEIVIDEDLKHFGTSRGDSHSTYLKWINHDS